MVVLSLLHHVIARYGGVARTSTYIHILTLFLHTHEQIHYIADNIMCCGAGTAADTEFTTAEIRSQIALHKLNTGREPRVVTAMTMLKQKLFQ